MNISIWHNKKYLNNIQVNIGKRELTNKGAVLTAVNYVLKNPIHHKITNVAYKYPYSSAHIYFKEQIYPDEYFKGERVSQSYKKPSEIESRVYKRLFASHKLPDDYQILMERFVIPSCFVKVNIIENLYSSVREFMFNMNKPLKEELEMFDSDHKNKGFSESEINLFGKLTDIEVCNIVDNFIYPKTYSQIMPNEKRQLAHILSQKGVDKFQFERVI